MLKRKFIYPILGLVLVSILSACGKTATDNASSSGISNALVPITGTIVNGATTGNYTVYNNPTTFIYYVLFGTYDVLSNAPYSIGSIPVAAGDTLVVDNRGDALTGSVGGQSIQISGNNNYKAQIPVGGFLQITGTNWVKIYNLSVLRCLNNGAPVLCP